MAENVTVRETRDLTPDLIGVQSRVSWSAIIAGTAIALACYLVFTLLLAAIGISMTEAGVRANAVGIGILVAMIATMVLSLFIGGWVSSQLTVGENRTEAVMYGLLTWAAVTAVSLMLVGMGVRAGYFAVVGGSVMMQNSERTPSLEAALRQSGVPDQQIAKVQAAMGGDPVNQEQAREAAVAASWTALVGTMLSMAAAVCGSLAGRGEAFRVFAFGSTRETRTRLVTPTA